MITKHYFISLWLFLFASTSAWAQEPLKIYYDERTPYAVTSSTGEVVGLTATPVASAFEAAGIPFFWKKMPFKRQLITIKANKIKACGIGWFKKPEREKFAWFSQPIYKDKPTIAISKKGNKSLFRHSTVLSLLKDKTLKLLVKDSFSYGSYLDRAIGIHQPEKLVVVGSSNLEMLQVLLSGRVDYFFVAEEEAEEMVNSAGYTMSQFDTLRLNDMPTGNNRYLACSQQVSPNKIRRFNKSLK